MRTAIIGAVHLVLLSFAAGACTTDNPSYCDEDKPCSDLAAPYCDLRGDFGPANTCVAAPELDASPEADATSTGDAAPPDAGAAYALTVTVEGAGTVTSNPTGIDCGDACSHDFPADTTVTVTATPKPGHRFLAWSGSCDGTALACDVTVSTPTTVVAQFEPLKVVQIAAGWRHTCALLNNGAVRCWGAGGAGQLGYANIEAVGDNELPADVGDVDIGGRAVQIAAGGQHSCAVLDTGALRCWGDGTLGQLGYGNTNRIGDNEPPSAAGDVDVGGTVAEVAAGFAHTCARLDTGAVRCWGAGELLGYGNTTAIGDTEPPSAAGDVDLGGIALQITAGFEHTCARLDTGAVRCWGHGTWGRLGYGNTSSIGDDETPASAGDVDVGRAVTDISAGGAHTCARLDSSGVLCWGASSHGQLGYSNVESIGDDEMPAAAGNVEAGGSSLQVSAGLAHTCARRSDGQLRCWGSGESGRLGYGNTNNIGDDETPASAGAIDLGDTAEQVSAGSYHTCTLLRTGAVRCWGDGTFGKLGYGNTESIGDDETPATAGDVPVF